MKALLFIPSMDVRRFNFLTSKVIGSNLKKDSRIEVEPFLDMFLKVNNTPMEELRKGFISKSSFEKIKGELEFIGFVGEELRFSYYMSKKFNISQFEKYDVIFASVIDTLELVPVEWLLKAGKKVVLGGALINIFNNENIRNVFRERGVSELELKNLVIFHGYVTKNTDLYEVANSKTDVTIQEKDLSSIYEAYDSPLESLFNLFRKIPNDSKERFLNPVNLDSFESNNIFVDFTCSGNKCKFCTFCKHPFTLDINDKEVGKKVRQNLDNGGDKMKNRRRKIYVRIDDSYLEFDKGGETEIFQLFPLDFSGNVGIKRIVEDEIYADKANQYLCAIRAGIENTTDYTLNIINKGFRRNDIDKAVDTMKRRFHRDMEIRFNFISDLPVKNRKDAIDNFAKILEIQDNLIKEGFRKVRINGHQLRLFSKGSLRPMKLTGIHPVNVNDKEFLFGEFRSRVLMSEYFGIDLITGFFPYMFMPFHRYDENGNFLESDYDIVPEEIFKEVVENNGDGY